MKVFGKKTTQPPSSLEDADNVVEINGKKFVAGLFWQQLSNPRSYMSEARAIGKKRDWDVVAIRQGLRVQAGFVNKKLGALKGMYSLAAALAGQLGDTWLGAFELRDGRFAVVAVMEGAIVPGYDVILSAEAALTRLREGANLFSFKEESIFAPASFSFAQRELNIGELLTAKRLRADYKLKQLRFGLTGKEIAKGLVFGGLLIAVGVGVIQFQAYRTHKELLRKIQLEQIRQDELKRLNENSKKLQTVQSLVHPWSFLPSAADFAEGCGTAVNSAALYIGGWPFDSATCDSKGVAFEYKRKVAGTTEQGFIAEAEGQFQDEPMFSDNGNTATVHRAFKPKFAGDEAVQSAEAVVQEFSSLLQTLDLKGTLAERTVTIPAPPLVPGQVAGPTVQPDWREFDFSYDSEIAPEMMVEAIQNKSSVRIKSIKVALNEAEASLKWTVTGDIYGKR